MVKFEIKKIKRLIIWTGGSSYNGGGLGVQDDGGIPSKHVRDI